MELLCVQHYIDTELNYYTEPCQNAHAADHHAGLENIKQWFMANLAAF